MDDAVPHTDGRCGHPPCGLYAAKDVRDLDFPALNALGRRRVALGLVALAGKVVEHEHGYRARRAEVRAMAVIGAGRVVRIGDRTTIERLFADPEATLDHVTETRPNAVTEVPIIRRAGMAEAAEFLESRVW